MDVLDHIRSAVADRYRIERVLGAGGMATVYLAADLKHDRKVAIKVLKPELAALLGAERFVVEIKTTAALQHPHILPLFDSGEADGFLYYVMPYIKGETIREKLNRETQFGVDDAVRIAREVSDALDYAHRHGVIHRDIKPENILLHDGRAMVMDFGIALAVSAAAGGRMTETGLSLGTPYYMSPEQATGERVIDARSDVYSLGAVTYEMLTGEPPHTGASAQAVIARVLTEKPRGVRAVRPTVPEHVDGAIERSLEKLAADRWASTKEFAEALSGTRHSAPSSSARSVVESSRRSRSWRALAVVGWVVAAPAIVLLARSATQSSRPMVPVRIDLELPDSVGLISTAAAPIAITRDGSTIALLVRPILSSRADTWAVFIRRMSDPVWRPVRGFNGLGSGVSPNGAGLSFSPDGNTLLLRSGGRLYKVLASGGPAQLFVDSSGFASWVETSDGKGVIVFGRGKELWRVSADGSDRRRIARLDSAIGTAGFAGVSAMPGGKYAVVSYSLKPRSADAPRIAIVSMKTGALHDLGISGGSARFVPPDRIVYVQENGTLASIPFSLRSLAVSGTAQPVAEPLPAFSRGPVVADNGTLAYITGESFGKFELLRVDRFGKETRLPFEGAPLQTARVSPDGRRAVVGIGARGGEGETRGDLWIYDLVAGTRVRFTTDSTGVRGEWTRDGSAIQYVDVERGERNNRVISRPWDQSGPRATLLELPPGSPFMEVSPGPPHGYTALRKFGGGASGDIYIAPAESLSAAKPFIATPAVEVNPRVSPDGKTLAYVSNETGQAEVYITPLPGPGPKAAVSTGGGNAPRWSHDGSTLFYLSATRLMAASITRTLPAAVTRRDSLFAWSYDSFDPFPDGRDFLVVSRVSTEHPKLVLLFNYPELTRH